MKQLAYLFLVLGLTATAQNPAEQIRIAKESLKDATVTQDSIKAYADLGWFYQYSNIDSGLYFNDRAGKLLKRVQDSAGQLQNRKEKADLLFRKGDYEESKSIYEQVIKTALQNSDSLMASKVETNLAAVNQSTGNYNEAMSGYLRALKFYENDASYSRFEGDVTGNIGSIYLYLGDNDKALEYYKRSELLHRSNKNYVALANTLSTTGSILLRQGDTINGYNNLTQAKEIATESQNYRTLAAVDHNLGYLLVDQKKFAQARPYLEEALNIKEQLGNDQETSISQLTYGQVLFANDEFNKAKNYFNQAQKELEKNKDFDRLLILYPYLSNTHAFLKQADSAAYYIDKQTDLLVQISEENLAQTTAELDKKYQTEKKERELAETKAELLANELKVQQRNLYLLILGLGLLFAIIIGWLIIRQKNLKNRQLAQEAKLKAANAEIENQNNLQKQRLRISRDLHDNIGSQLTFMISSMDSLRYAKSVAPETTNEKLKNLSAFTRTTINELRDTIWAMNHDQITFQDLEERLTTHITNARQSGVETELRLAIDGNIDQQHAFDSVTGMHIFRSIQEAVNNAIKHSNSEVIHIAISKITKDNNAAFEIKVIDQGAGFVAMDNSEGNGLRNMKERLESINGDLLVDSTPDTGTTITMVVPA